MKPIELSDISHYRKPLMGMAMLFIMLFHTDMHHWYAMYSLKSLGNYGVDIFLFLSGIGLWFSWTNNPSLKRFFHRRIWRVYPEYLIIASIYYISDYLSNTPKIFTNVPDMIGNIAINLCFWNGNSRAFWFVPAIMALYAFAPLYMNLIIKKPAYRWTPVVFILLPVLLQYNHTANDIFGHLELLTSRIPIFLIGLNCGDAIKNRKQLPASSWPLILLTFAISLTVALTLSGNPSIRYPIFLLRLCYIPLTISSILLMCQMFRASAQWVVSGISFVGGISLECYLIHEPFVLNYFRHGYDLGYCLTALTTIPIAILLAWILHDINHLIVHISK